MLTKLGAFGIGYVLGARAGKERYEQIREWAEQAARRLETYGASGSMAMGRHAHGDGLPPSRRR